MAEWLRPLTSADHLSLISPLWAAPAAEWLRPLTSADHLSMISPPHTGVRASHGAQFTCGTIQVQLAGVSGGFSSGFRFLKFGVKGYTIH